MSDPRSLSAWAKLYDVENGVKRAYYTDGSSGATPKSVDVRIDRSATASEQKCPCCGQSLQKGSL